MAKEPEIPKEEIKPPVKTGTSADKVTESAEFERQINELRDKLTKAEKTRENEKILGDMGKELDLLKTKIPLISGGNSDKSFWQVWLDELDEFFKD